MSAKKKRKGQRRSDSHKNPKISPEIKEEKRRYSVYTEMLIKGGSQLRKKLKIGEDSFSFVYGPNTGNPKNYYLMGALNDVEKAAMAVMYEADFVVESKVKLGSKPTDATGFRIANNSLQVKIDALSLSERKMTETLVDLIGFRRANSQDYYRHYVVLHELDAKKKILNDMYEFSGIKNKNLSHQISELEQQADLLAAKLDPQRCWYAKKKKGKLTCNISTFNNRFKDVFSHMKEYEKAALISYGASFGRQSGLLHSGKPVDREELTLDNLGAHIGRVSILATHVLNAAKDLGRIHNVTGVLKTIADSIKKNDYPITLYRQRTRPDIAEGDFVVTVWGNLAQVKKVMTSKHGHKAFRIKYLDKLPMPGIPIDDYPAENLRLLYARKPLIEKMKAVILKATPKLKPSTRQLNRSMEDSVVHMWNDVGLKEFLLKNPEAGYAKVKQEIDRLKNQSK